MVNMYVSNYTVYNTADRIYIYSHIAVWFHCLCFQATEMQDGSGGLSAKATEFVPGPGNSADSSPFVRPGGRVSGLSPKATEYVPAEGWLREGV